MMPGAWFSSLTRAASIIKPECALQIQTDTAAEVLLCNVDEPGNARLRASFTPYEVTSTYDVVAELLAHGS